jgi:uncharacterized protein YxjI
MDEVLNRNHFLVKEHVGMFKAANNFDIHEPESGEKILECREENLGVLTKLLRFTDFKRMTPFHVEIRKPDGTRIVEIRRGVSVFLSRVEVTDGHGRKLGGFQQRFLSIGGKFDVLDAADQPVCSLRGKWTGWNFRFERNGSELAQVSKKWSGIGRELFTSADNYMLQIAATVPRDDPARPLILAAVMCIDMVLKE